MIRFFKKNYFVMVMIMKKNAISSPGPNCRSERGAVLVIALLMLVILSIMGGFALTVGMLEEKVTKNSEIFQHNFYAVEAVTLEGATKIFKEDDKSLMQGAYTWMRTEDDLDIAGIDMDLSSQWPNHELTPNNTSLTSGKTRISPAEYTYDSSGNGDRIWYAAVDKGPCPMGSGREDAHEHCWDVYGMYDVKRAPGKTYTGRLMTKIGYKVMVYAAAKE